MTARELTPDRVTNYLLKTEPELLAGIDTASLTTPDLIERIGIDKFLQVASSVYSAEVVDLDKNPPNPELNKKYLTEDKAFAHMAVVLSDSNGAVTIAFGYPNHVSFEVIKQALPKPMLVALADPSQIQRHLQRIFKLSRSTTSNTSNSATGSTDATNQSTPQKETIVAEDDDQTAKNLFDFLLNEAIRLRASDIHLSRNSRGEFEIKFRRDGILQTAQSVQQVFDRENARRKHVRLEGDLANMLINFVHVLAGMAIERYGYPQDGAFAYQLSPNDQSSIIQARVASIPTVNGTMVVIRILPRRGDLIPLEKQGFRPRDYDLLTRIAEKPQGLFLVTGPTGSGKSTTLAAIIDRLRGKGKIITIEDPVEYRYPDGVDQIDLAGQKNFGFAEALRSTLRLDPDIILVGEIRDSETAQIATRASNTGHMVFSTLHTNNSTLAINRLEDMGVPRHLIIDNLSGAMAVRLLPRLCQHCAIDTEPDVAAIKAAGYSELLENNPHPKTKKRGPGCPHCNYTGYRGRVPVHELFAMTKDMKIALANGANSEELRKIAIDNGMTTLMKDAISLYLKGEIDINAALGVETEL